MEFTHFDHEGKAVMVDITEKQVTHREATARGFIQMSGECFQKVAKGSIGKGDVLGIAGTAGIMAAKKTAELIPLCHTILLTKVSVTFEMQPEHSRIIAVCTAVTDGKTGVEMEALTGVNIALLTIYDMCKAVDKRMEMGNIHLEQKCGGKSGNFLW